MGYIVFLCMKWTPPHRADLLLWQKLAAFAHSQGPEARCVPDIVFQAQVFMMTIFKHNLLSTTLLTCACFVAVFHNPDMDHTSLYQYLTLWFKYGRPYSEIRVLVPKGQDCYICVACFFAHQSQKMSNFSCTMAQICHIRNLTFPPPLQKKQKKKQKKKPLMPNPQLLNSLRCCCSNISVEKFFPTYFFWSKSVLIVLYQQKWVYRWQTITDKPVIFIKMSGCWCIEIQEFCF